MLYGFIGSMCQHFLHIGILLSQSWEHPCGVCKPRSWCLVKLWIYQTRQDACHTQGGLAQVAERSLSMREAPGSMPGFSKFQTTAWTSFFFFFVCVWTTCILPFLYIPNLHPKFASTFLNKHKSSETLLICAHTCLISSQIVRTAMWKFSTKLTIHIKTAWHLYLPFSVWLNTALEWNCGVAFNQKLIRTQSVYMMSKNWSEMGQADQIMRYKKPSYIHENFEIPLAMYSLPLISPPAVNWSQDCHCLSWVPQNTHHPSQQFIDFQWTTTLNNFFSFARVIPAMKE